MADWRDRMVIITDPSTGVSLRGFEDRDIPRLIETAHDPDTLAWTQMPHGYTAESARWFFANIVGPGWEKHDTLIWAIVDDTDTYCGHVDLRLVGHGLGGLGYVMHPDRRRRGILRTALQMVLDHAFELEGLDLVQWNARAGNFSSWWPVADLGFRFEGRRRLALVERNQRWDLWTGSVTAEERRRTRVLRPPVLEIDGGRLRLVTHHDADRIVACCRDEDTRRWLTGLPADYRRCDAIAFIDRAWDEACAGTSIHWAVVDDTNQLLGVVELRRIPHRPEVGYYLHPEARGQGWMTRAVAAVAAWAEHQHLPPVEIEFHNDNSASAAIADRCGFTETTDLQRRRRPM